MSIWIALKKPFGQKSTSKNTTKSLQPHHESRAETKLARKKFQHFEPIAPLGQNRGVLQQNQYVGLTLSLSDPLTGAEGSQARSLNESSSFHGENRFWFGLLSLAARTTRRAAPFLTGSRSSHPARCFSWGSFLHVQGGVVSWIQTVIAPLLRFCQA